MFSSFAYPWVFLLAPIVVLVPWIRKRQSVAFSSVNSMMVQRTLRMKLVFLPSLLASLAGLCLLTALARPQVLHHKEHIEKEGIDIMLLVDTSGSMRERDYALKGRRISRMEISKQVLNDFVTSRANDRLGIVVFGEEAFSQCPLTLDHDGMLPFLDQIQIGLAGDKATAIGDGIAIAGQHLSELDAPTKVVILLTDGQSNAGIDPVVAADAAAQLGIRIYTIGLGGGNVGMGGLLLGSRGGVDEASLDAIAKRTGGKFYLAQTTKALQKVYEEIDDLETTTAETFAYTIADEKYAPWVLLSIVLLLLQMILSETWLRRLP